MEAEPLLVPLLLVDQAAEPLPLLAVAVEDEEAEAPPERDAAWDDAVLPAEAEELPEGSPKDHPGSTFWESTDRRSA